MDLLKDIETRIAEEKEDFETSDEFKKGMRVKHKGKARIVEVPDAKAGFVGVVPVGKEGDEEAVDLVPAKELTIAEHQLLKGFSFEK